MIVVMYRKMYTTLYNAVTDALEDLADADYAGAAERLRRAQRETEEIFVLWEEACGWESEGQDGCE